ncbi:MAG TPA: lactonase family protein [Gemmatirosa sp.]
MNRRDFLASSAGALWLASHPSIARAAVCAPSAGAPEEGHLVYVGTYTENGRTEGIFRFRVHPTTGEWRPIGATAAGPNPSFLALHPRGTVLYAVNEVEQYEGAATGAVSAFAIAPGSGELTPLGQRRASGGGAPAYVSVDRAGRYALVANYVGGSVAALPLGADGSLGEVARLDPHHGSGPRTDRQEGPHAHSIVPDPSDRFALSADLGTDHIYVYALGGPAGPLAPAAVPSVAVAAGAGPRHLAFHPNGRFVYVSDELALTVAAFRFDPATGALAPLGTASLVAGPAPATERTAADLHFAPSGRFLYASVRGDNTLVVFGVDAGTGALTFVQRVPTGGDWPRNFGLDPAGRFLYVANQRSNTITAFRVDAASGRVTPTGTHVEVPAPVCVRFLG